MKQHPILFKPPMLRAIHNGSKTQTRRIVKARFKDSRGWGIAKPIILGDSFADRYKCPYGKPGDGLYVKEPFRIDKIGMGRPGFTANVRPNMVTVEYRPSEEYPLGLSRYVELSQKHIDMIKAWKRPNGWMSSLFMFEPLARTRLLVESIRVERLKDITEEDAKAEGVTLDYRGKNGMGCSCGDYRCRYGHLWTDINGEDSWEANPAVWVITFKNITP